LKKRGQTIRHPPKDNGFFYIFDSHPVFLTSDTEKLPNRVTEIQHPYFGKESGVEDSTGGYAAETKRGVQAYFWMCTVSDIINALTSAGSRIAYFKEYAENYFCDDGLRNARDSLFNYDFNNNMFPMSFRLKATAI